MTLFDVIKSKYLCTFKLGFGFKNKKYILARFRKGFFTTKLRTSNFSKLEGSVVAWSVTVSVTQPTKVVPQKLRVHFKTKNTPLLIMNSL